MNKKLGYAKQGYILAQFGSACFGCKDTNKPLEMAHRIAESLGGTLSLDNLMSECRACNNSRQDMSDVEAYGKSGALEIMLRKAIEPSKSEIAIALYNQAVIIKAQAVKRGQPVPRSLRLYLGSKLHKLGESLVLQEVINRLDKVAQPEPEPIRPAGWDDARSTQHYG